MRSNHLFIFPFRFDRVLKKVSSFDELCSSTELFDRVDISSKHHISEVLDGTHWVYDDFRPSLDTEHYNMFANFFDHIRPLLFNKKEESGQLSHLFYHEEFEDKKGYVELELGDKLVRLDVEKVFLRIFEAGVGVLALNLINKDIDDLALIAEINSALRMVYPVDLVEKNGKYIEQDFFKRVSFFSSKREVSRFENNFERLEDEPPIYSYIKELIGEEIFSFSLKSIGKFYIKPIIGSEMFVMCHYVDNKTFNNIKNDDDFFSKKSWQKLFLMGDEFSLVKSFGSSFVQADFHSWLSKDAVFGLSKNAFFMVTKEYNTHMEKKFRTLFFKIITLIVSIRSSINRLTEDVTSISATCDPKVNPADNLVTLESIETLYKFYVRFINRLHFRDITIDRDGEMLHKSISKSNNIEKKLEMINLEIKNLYNLFNYTRTISEKRKQEFGDKLTLMGGVFLPAGVLSGVFGMNIFDTSDLTWQEVVATSVVTYLLVGVFLMKSIIRTVKRAFR
jgi:hypothetical protein